jgi:protein-L-isoaspartate(D-aspartate) O-methyltransferase
LTDAQPDDFAMRRQMVERQIRSRGVRNPAVLAAMALVPRHEFVPASLVASAYSDHPLPIGEGQTISQPYIVALMTEALELGPRSRVLELGTGSGYQAAVLATIAEVVFTIEYFRSLAEETAQRLARLGYHNVVIRTGDGWNGWPERGPFDGVILTFAAPEVPPALADQLVPGGRLCAPIGDPEGAQELMLYRKRGDGSLSAEDICPVRFVPVQR